MLVVDPQAGATSVIECGIEGDGKWRDMAALGDKLYCSPSGASGVLVIDPLAGTTTAIPCAGVAGSSKWAGIAAWGGRLYCAPNDAPGVLVIDQQAGTTSVINCDVAGTAKWDGIAAWGDKLYCAPVQASGVLVIDPQAGTTRVIQCGVAGSNKWMGIVAWGDRLYCAPLNAPGILEINPQAGTTTVIECPAGDFKWMGIAALGGKLYCAPHRASSVLVYSDENTLAAAGGGTTKADASALNDSCKGGIDRFGYRAYAQAFRAMLGRAAPPIAVGLYARWGAGKSFMIFLLKQQFDPLARTDPPTHDLVQWFEDGYDTFPPSISDDDAQAELSDKAAATGDARTAPPKPTTCREKCAMLAELFGCCALAQRPITVPWGLLTLWALVDEVVRELLTSVHTWLSRFAPPTMHRVDTCLAPCLRKRGRALRRSVVGTALGAIFGREIGDALALEVSVDGFRFVNHRLAWTVAGALLGVLVAVCVGTKTPQPAGTFRHEQDVESSLPQSSQEKMEFKKEYILVDFNAW